MYIRERERGGREKEKENCIYKMTIILKLSLNRVALKLNPQLLNKRPGKLRVLRRS